MSRPSAARPAALDQHRVAAATVKRYWPGRAPDWVNEEAAAEEPEAAEEDDAEEPDRSAFVAPVIVKPVNDPRLRRLAERQSGAKDRSEDSDDERARTRAALRRHTAIAVEAEQAAGSEGEDSDDDSSALGDADEEEDEEDIAARRAAVRARLQEQPEAEALPEAEEEAEDEGSSEYETESEDEGNGRMLLKPQFVPKAARETILERERLEREEEELAAKQQKRLDARKAETRELVIERLELEKAAEDAVTAGPAGASDIDTDDEVQEEEEYEAWKVRELARLARDREEREKEAQQTTERERLKTMNEEERRQWERENPKVTDFKEKQKWKFMQKYWHKGAYYQTGGDDQFQDDAADTIYARDFSAPVGEDKFDRTILPKVMQVKNFGRRGRVKHTHLVDVDTTDFDNPLAPDLAVQRKFQSKMAGTEQVFTKPKTLKT